MKVSKIFFIFSALTGAGILYYLFTYISFSEVLNIVSSVNSRALYLFFILSFAGSYFRLWRYQIILEQSGYRARKLPLFLVVLVRNFFSDLLPARIGTAVFIFLAKTRLGIPYAAATSGFALSFLFDIVAITPLILIAVILATVSSVLNVPLIVIGSCVLCLISCSLIYFLPVISELLSESIKKITIFPSYIVENLSQLLNQTALEIKTARKSGIYWRILLLSLLVRVGKYGSLYAFLNGLLQPLGFKFEAMPISKVFLGFCAPELSASLPISGIAAFGVYEGTWALTFKLLGFPAKLAILTAVSHHLFTQVYACILAIFSLIFLLVPQLQVKGVVVKEKYILENASAFYSKLITILLILVLLIFAVMQVPNAHSTSSKTEPAVRTPSRSEAHERLVAIKDFPGDIVFDSNRSGTFGIFRMEADGANVRVIYDASENEIFPDASPDGKLIVFAKSMGLARISPSDIWLVDASGENARLLVEDGTFPSFSSDGRSVYFERRREKVMKIDIDGKNLQEIFPSDLTDEFEKYEIVKPAIAADAKSVVFTSDRAGRWNVWKANLIDGTSSRVEEGCEGRPPLKSGEIPMVLTKNSFAGSGIFKIDPILKSRSTLVDAESPLGHEYFPSIVASERYLLYAASPFNQHDHNSANYQIFVKDLSAGHSSTDPGARITFDQYTNRWPKLLIVK